MTTPKQKANLPTRRVTVEGVHPFSGVRSQTDYPTLTQLLGLAAPPTAEWLLFLEWPADPAALRVEVTGKDGQADLGFSDTREDAAKLFQKFRIPQINWPEVIRPDGAEGHKYLAAVVPPTAALTFVFEVDTNHERINRAVRYQEEAQRIAAELGADDPTAKAARREAEAEADLACPPVLMSGYKKFTETSPLDFLGANRRGYLGVNPVPLTPMAGYPGYVAIDLGNTGSMVAYMPEEGEDVAEMRLIDLDGRGREGIPTAVRVTEYARPPSPPPGADDPPARPMAKAKWKYGQAALDLKGTAGALILGAKRLLSDPSREPAEQVYRVWLETGDQTIPKSDPAELFLAGLVQEFHRAHGDHPRQIAGPRPGGGTTCGLAVTCPTTFSIREINNLRRAVYSGWRRALGATKYKFPKPDMDRVIAEVIDEASAAAMFYIYRDFMWGPGYARGFRSLYPDGMNVLVYDCGGGTTDIALVRARAEYRGGEEDRVSQLHIEVIGRTGHRGFGGDNVTKAVFAVLKARAAEKLHGAKKKFNLPPAVDPAAVAAAIAAQSAEIDNAFPTRFKRADLRRPEVREQAEAVMELWKEAERIKEALGEKAEARAAALPESGGKIGKHVATALGVSQPGQVARALKEAVVTRAEVDAIVRPDVRTTIARANGLIHRRLWPAPAAGAAAPPAPVSAGEFGEEVHKVYVLGRASQYPLIQECLRSGLDIAFLKDDPDLPGLDADKDAARRLVFDKENLKGAVAKGAVAALRMRKAVDGVEVAFDNSLINRLPFDIWYTDLGRGPECLYEEGLLYDDLEERVVPKPDVPDEAPQTTGKTVFLRRKWPDETTPQRYLRFRFPREVAGDLRVEYHPVREDRDDPPHFTMTDTGNGYTAIGEEEPEAEYVSPPQSGEL